MNILYVDTTTSDLVVALVKDNEVVNVSQKAMGVKHSETLCNKVAELLAKANVTFAEIDAYACAIGPGSFTGIRIGISTIKGYATACEKPFIAVNCLQAIACSATCNGNGTAILDAGNGYYYYSNVTGTASSVIPYDDKAAEGCATAQGATDYLDGAVEIVRQKYTNGSFDTTLTPLYIRKSQAEVNYGRKA